jgi:hypothetical protein
MDESPVLNWFNDVKAFFSGCRRFVYVRLREVLQESQIFVLMRLLYTSSRASQSALRGFAQAIGISVA